MSALPGFEHFTKFWDDEHALMRVPIKPGQFYVTKDNEAITTTLGSCVSACIYDITAKIGGMNHFLLPVQEQESPQLADYGNWAMEFLINEIIKNGGNRKHLQAKIFGGSEVVHIPGHNNIGKGNIEFVLKYLATEGIPVINQDLGGPYARKIIFEPLKGSVKLKHLSTESLRPVETEELIFLHEVSTKQRKTKPELFTRQK